MVPRALAGGPSPFSLRRRARTPAGIAHCSARIALASVAVTGRPAVSQMTYLGANCVVAANLAERFWAVMNRGMPYVAWLYTRTADRPSIHIERPIFAA